ncbi:ABC transporter ATP-binding protein [Paenibacillus eucommiae]|uniref:ABC-2 type transport system ATP-binding protein n=1 Tax=Paenibacillus eucommiae TaxID=1355755 RepID=A0ABS4IR69_9BACL|nr:ABC transporter ATP-binding protein [Paenibacillus eucommiae]MBP1990064.1 ABC-2 type transport system ATP-binding protein [Paenibacillus eucommiae]
MKGKLQILNVNIEQAGYDNQAVVLHDIRFSLMQGELVGLLGPNGAGKSTTIKAILGLLRDFKGEISFTGKRQNYAYIPEQPILYDQLTLWEHLELAAAAYEMERPVFIEKAEKLVARFRLQEVKHHLPSSFSKGMQQKIMLILGFLIEPDLYVVDEPFVGLDPRAIKDFLDLLEQERKRGAAVLMSTHVLDTAEKICDRHILLDRGSIVAQGYLPEIREQCGLPNASLFECFHSLT